MPWEFLKRKSPSTHGIYFCIMMDNGNYLLFNIPSGYLIFLDVLFCIQKGHLTSDLSQFISISTLTTICCTIRILVFSHKGQSSAPQYFIPLHSIHTVGNFMNMYDQSYVSHVIIKYSSILMTSYRDFLT